MKTTQKNSNFVWILLLFVIGTTNSVNASITYTVGNTGSGANYSTIAAAYAACNTSAQYFIEIRSDYSTEALPITLDGTNNAYRSSSNTVTIRPKSGVTGLTITQASAANLFDISGASYLIIDGRPGGSGSSDFTIQNTNTAAASRVFYVEKGANHVTVQYCTIKGSNQSTTLSNAAQAGVIYFDGNATAALTNNTFDNCTIGSSTGGNPAYMFVSYCQSAGQYCDLNTISNCSIYNFTSGAVKLEQYNNRSWSITGNSFYQSASFTPSTALYFIDANTDGTAGGTTTITGNYFGGQAASCGSSASKYTLSGTTANEIRIISITGSNTTNTISNNTIANISFTNTVDFSAIAYGKASVLSAAVTISNNSMSEIYATAPGTSGNFYGLYINGSSNSISVTSNTIGSASSNNIKVDGSPLLTSLIFVLGGGTISCTGNTIQNIQSTYSTAGQNYGVIRVINISATTTTLSNNTIQNITSGAYLGGTGGSCTAIYFNSTLSNNTISNNTINTLSSYGTTYGIFVRTSCSGTINNNYIKSMNTNISAALIVGQGIEIQSTGIFNIYNNVIILDCSSNATLVGMGAYLLSGTFPAAGTSSVFYHNTVKISGTATSMSSYAFYDYATGSRKRLVKNNIFQNVRTGGSGLHFAVYVQLAPSSTYDYNYEEVSANQNNLGYYNGGNKTFSNWKTGSGASHDQNGTITIDDNTGMVTGSSDYTLVRALGTDLTAMVVYDYKGHPRPTASTIGAFELVVDWTGTTSTNWNTATNWYPQRVPLTTDYANIGVVAYTSGNNPNASSTPATAVSSITFGNATTPTLTVGTGATITCTNTLMLYSYAAADATATITGAGTLSAAAVYIGNSILTTVPTSSQTTTLNTTLTALNISGNVTINGYYAAYYYNNGVFSLNSGTTTVAGTVTLSPATSSTASIVNTGGSQDGTLVLTGTTPFATGSGTNTLTFTGTSSTVSYNSASVQPLYPTNYNNLTVTGGGGKTMSGAVTVNATLTFNGSYITLGTNNLTIGNNGSITGYTSTYYAITNSSGALTQNNLGTGGRTGGIVFPIGISAASYTPITINNSGTADNFSIYAALHALENGTTGSAFTTGYVDRTWFISEDTPGGSNVIMTPQWNTVDELSGFDHTLCAVTHYTNTWHKTSIAAAASGSNPYTIPSGTVTSFSPFSVTSVIPLGIELLSFTTDCDETEVKLRWKTAAEQNNAYFSIERSDDGVHFDEIAQIQGAGNSSSVLAYEFTDKKHINQNGEKVYNPYYRLKQVDIDGKSTYLGIENAGCNTPAGEMSIFPNPASNYFICEINNTNKQISKLQLIDLTGRIIFSQTLNVEYGMNQYSLSIEDLQIGVYQVVVTSPSDEVVFSSKLVKK